MYHIFAVDVDVLPGLLFNLSVTMFGLAVVISMVRRRKERAREVPDLPTDEPTPDLRLPDRSPMIQPRQEPP